MNERTTAPAGWSSRGTSRSEFRITEAGGGRQLLRFALFGAVALVAVLAPFLVEGISVSDLTRTVATTISLAGLMVIMGYAGQLSMGHGALTGVGAYSMVLFVGRWGFSYAVGIVLAILVGAVIGAIVALPSFRVGGIQLALVTFTIATAFPPLVNRLAWLTGGPGGSPIPRLPAPGWFPDQSRSGGRLFGYFLAVTIAVVVFVALTGVLRSRVGRAWQASRDNPLAAAAVGIPVGLSRVGAYALGGALAGLGGSLLLVETPFVVPTQFGPFVSIELYAAIVIAGARSLWGPLVGALIITLLPELLFRRWGLGAEEWVIPIVLVLATFLRPQGLLPPDRPRSLAAPSGEAVSTVGR